MLAVRYYPELATPALWNWLQEFVKYDGDGRGSCWLVDGGRPLSPLLESLGDFVMPGVNFSGVLLQSYRDGNAVTPCHTDNGGTGDGFILSLGAPRTFRVHRMDVDCDDPDAVFVKCREGTVLVMDEAFHAGWHHQVTADPDIDGEKLSLVFRTTPRGA